MISRETIDEVKNRVDIVDVISDFVSLKKSGQNYKALSPFSNEKTPSFFVVPSKGIFKDFSSGKGGDSFTFVMEHEKLSYAEAIRYLAKKYGVEIKEDKLSDESREQQTEREGLYILMNFAKEFYKNALLQTEEGTSIGLSYFRERGFNDRTLEKFELGYALEGWENFSKEAISKGYNKDLLEKTGLVVKKDDGSSYDRFRGRVIFPVHNISGKVIAFGARMMGKDKNQPKYINSPETEIYHKSDVLYGLYQGKNAIRNAENCYLVEGYTDVISMHQAGVENVVASSGTALTEGQIKLIHRFTENVTVLFDGDSAGIKAALRGIDMFLKGGLNVRVLLFPDGEDPDSYSCNGGSTQSPSAWYASTFRPSSFKTSLYAAEPAGDPIRKAESIKEIITSIAVIPDPVKRSVYIQETSNLLKIAEPVLLTELNKILIQERRKTEKEKLRDQEEYNFQTEAFEQKDAKAFQITAKSRIVDCEKSLLDVLVNYYDIEFGSEKLIDFVENEINDVEIINPIHSEIFQALIRFKELNLPYNTTQLSESLSIAAKKLLTDLLVKKYKPSENWKKYKIVIPENPVDLEKVVRIIKDLKFWHLRSLMEEQHNIIKQQEESFVNWDELEKSLEKFFSLKKFEVGLAEDLGYVFVI